MYLCAAAAMAPGSDAGACCCGACCEGSEGGTRYFFRTICTSFCSPYL
eukprot:COSAG04_NODE_1824_length_5487_cov_1.894395_5_plen_47_part_01